MKQEIFTLTGDPDSLSLLSLCLHRFSFSASLIRGNRSNCALFCDNLDWLVSKLDRLEASSGKHT